MQPKETLSEGVMRAIRESANRAKKQGLVLGALAVPALVEAAELQKIETEVQAQSPIVDLPDTALSGNVRIEFVQSLEGEHPKGTESSLYGALILRPVFDEEALNVAGEARVGWQQLYWTDPTTLGYLRLESGLRIGEGPNAQIVYGVEMGVEGSGAGLHAELGAPLTTVSAGGMHEIDWEAHNALMTAEASVGAKLGERKMSAVSAEVIKPEGEPISAPYYGVGLDFAKTNQEKERQSVLRFDVAANQDGVLLRTGFEWKQ